MLLRPATMSFKWLFEATYLNFGEDKKKRLVETKEGTRMRNGKKMEGS